MSDKNDPQVTFKIQNMSITMYSCNVWQTIFGTMIVTYILYRKIRKRKADLTKGKIQSTFSICVVHNRLLHNKRI